VRCTACGADNPPDNRFCADCGAALSIRASTAPAEAASWFVPSSVPLSHVRVGVVAEIEAHILLRLEQVDG
jgi:hypothetical protein